MEALKRGERGQERVFNNVYCFKVILPLPHGASGTRCTTTPGSFSLGQYFLKPYPQQILLSVDRRKFCQFFPPCPKPTPLPQLPDVS